MSRSYGKIPRGGKGKAALTADRLIIDIKGRHTLEQFTHEMAKAIARLQERGVHGVENCTVYLKPLDSKGGTMALWNEKGEPITRLPLTDEAEPPPYRQG